MTKKEEPVNIIQPQQLPVSYLEVDGIITMSSPDFNIYELKELLKEMLQDKELGKLINTARDSKERKQLGYAG